MADEVWISDEQVEDVNGVSEQGALQSLVLFREKALALTIFVLNIR